MTRVFRGVCKTLVENRRQCFRTGSREDITVGFTLSLSHIFTSFDHLVKPWISRREQLGQYVALMRELGEEDQEAFINYMRLPLELYDEVLARITHRIIKQDTWWRQALDPGQRFQILLSTMQHTPDSVIIVHASVCLHNLIRIRYPNMNINQVDLEDIEGAMIVPGECRWG